MYFFFLDTKKKHKKQETTASEITHLRTSALRESFDIHI